MPQSKLFLLTLAVLGHAAPIAGCAIEPPRPVYFFERRPGTPLHNFLAGELGIIDGTWEAPYLLIAFRHLSGLGMDERTRSAFAAFFEEIDASPSRKSAIYGPAVGQWIKALQEAGVENAEWVGQTRQQKEVVGDTQYLEFFVNCNDDAFLTAARTLADQLRLYGRNSLEVEEWISGQLMVFRNCVSGSAIPEPLDGHWDPRLRADREYQIAAAHFYAGDYEEAECRFRRIAAQNESRWARLAAYLVARCQIRSGDLRSAEQVLRRIPTDPRLSDVHGAAERLLKYVRYRLAPDEARQDLLFELLAPSVRGDLTQRLTDLSWIPPKPRFGGQRTGHEEDFEVWLTAMWRDPSGPRSFGTGWRELHRGSLEAARGRFWRTHDLTWLAPTLANLQPSDSGVEELSETASKVPAESPLYLTAVYHRARLLIAKNRGGEVKGDLEALLQAPGSGLSPSDRNKLRALRAKLAGNVTEYVHWSLAEQLGWRGEGIDLSFDADVSGAAPQPPVIGLPWKVLVELDRAVGLRSWLDLLNQEDLPVVYQQQLAGAGWVRSILAGEDTLAEPFAARLQTVVPELAEELSRWRTAPSGEEQRFAAAMLLLRFPGLQPTLRLVERYSGNLAEIDLIRQGNWWWAGVAAGLTFGYGQERLPWMEAEEKDPLAKLQSVPSAPVFLGEIVLAWARSNRNDSRLPEALHRVVQATHYSQRSYSGEDFSKISRAAFLELHRRHPDSKWTAATPYWYR